MEFAQLHTARPQSLEAIEADLRGVIPAAAIHPRGALGVALLGPWRPADVWCGGLERVTWTVGLEASEPLLSMSGIDRLGREGALRRHAPVHPVENLARRQGEGLVMLYSDAARLAYVAVYRERHLTWSLMLQDNVRLVRCDGEVVLREAPPKWVAEGDRTGVLLAGLQHWLREPIEVPPEDRFTFPDTLGALTASIPIRWLIQGGEWEDDGDPRRAARASAS